MLLMKVQLLTNPGIDLSLFRGICSAEQINETDSRNGHPVNKFAELVVDALSRSGDFPFKHLHISFYFEMPLHIFSDLASFGELSITSQPHGLQAIGIVSGSFLQWRDFLIWATTEEQSGLMRMFAASIHKTLAQVPPFNKLQTRPFQDSTYGLVKL